MSWKSSARICPAVWISALSKAARRSRSMAWTATEMPAANDASMQFSISPAFTLELPIRSSNLRSQQALLVGSSNVPAHPRRAEPRYTGAREHGARASGSRASGAAGLYGSSNAASSRLRQHHPAILLPLASPNRDLAALEIDVLDPQF